MQTDVCNDNPELLTGACPLSPWECTVYPLIHPRFTFFKKSLKLFMWMHYSDNDVWKCDKGLPTLTFCNFLKVNAEQAGTWRAMWICTSIVVLFTVAKGRSNSSKCPLTDEWVSKMWYLHITEHCSAFIRKETLSHATAWVRLDMMLSVK